jgi:MFS family permease
MTWASLQSKLSWWTSNRLPWASGADKDCSDYNTGQTIFLTSFLAAELPGGLLSKKIGPDRMTPIAITLWGVACAAQAAMKDRASFFGLRALIGALQGGFIPEMVLYLSYYYKGHELPMRLSIFWTAIPLSQIFGSLVAAGLLKLRGVSGWAGWQWLYAKTPPTTLRAVSRLMINPDFWSKASCVSSSVLSVQVSCRRR